MRLPRALTAFIEAEGVTVAASGGINVTIAVGDSPDPSSPVFPAQFVLFCAEPVIKEIQCP